MHEQLGLLAAAAVVVVFGVEPEVRVDVIPAEGMQPSRVGVPLRARGEAVAIGEDEPQPVLLQRLDGGNQIDDRSPALVVVGTSFLQIRYRIGLRGPR